MDKVAVYCRVSTEEQRERQSINNQIEQAKDYCHKNELIISDFYLDEGLSGTIPFDQRPEGKRLLEDSKLNKFKIVLIWKIDRLGRDTKNSLIIAHSLRDIGIGIISMTEPFDTSTPMGEFMFTQLASFAKLERDNIRERSIIGTNRIAKQGKWLGGIVAYGYYVDESKNLVINENKLLGLNYSEADIIRMIYKWIGNDGLSTMKVADRLNSMNIPPHYTKDNRKFNKPIQNTKPSERNLETKGKRKVNTSGRWHPHRIGNLIRNTTYMGIHRYGKRSKKPRELIDREVPAIVTVELWNKAQQTLRNNFLWSKRNSKREYLLRGLIRCGKCGRNLSGSYRKPGSWYRCNGRSMHVQIGTGQSCNLKSVKADWLENLVWNDIKEWILNPVSLEVILENKLNKHQKDKKNCFIDFKKYNDQLEKKEQERSNILTLYRKNIISMNDVESQLKDVDQDKKELELLIKETKAKMIDDYSSKEIVEEIKSQLETFKAQIESGNITFNYKRKIIELLIKDVVINLTKDNKHTVLLDTIPFRDNMAKRSNKGYEKVETVYMRFSNGNNEKRQELQSDTINICYRFPLQNKQLSSIVQHTDMDS